MIQQLYFLKHSNIFLNLYQYLFPNFFRFILEEVIQSESDPNIKSFFNPQSINLIQESKNNNLYESDNEIEEYKVLLTPKAFN